jgi:transglutaminase-like putative cysteine protease
LLGDGGCQHEFDSVDTMSAAKRVSHLPSSFKAGAAGGGTGTLLALAFTSIAAFGFWRVFDRPSVGWLSLVSAAIGGLAIAPITRRRFGAISLALLGVSFAGAIAGTLIGDGSLTDSLVAVFTGPAEIIGARWPAAAQARALGFVGFASALAGGLTAVLRHMRLAGPASLVPGVSVVLLSAMLGAPAGPPSALFLAMLTVVGGLMLSRSTRQRRAPKPQPALLIVLATTIATIGLASAWVGSRANDRFDPRTRRDLGADLELGVSPLTVADELRAEQPPRSLFSSTGTTVDRWRLVALNRFDGRAWMPPRQLERAKGRLVRRTEERRLGTSPVIVTVSGLTGRWLPTADGRVSRIETAVRTDADTSAFLSDTSLESGFQYRFDGVAASTPDTLAETSPANTQAQAELLLYEPSAGLQALATRITAGRNTVASKATALADYLRANYQLDAAAPAGHSAALTELFLTTTNRGREEQFVSGFAVLATALGLPVRIAVGFTPPLGSTTVTTADAHAWPEIAFADLGWVRFDPVPPEAGPPTTRTNVGAGSAQRVDAPPPPTTTPPPSTPTNEDDLVRDRDIKFSKPVLVGFMAVALVATWLLLVPLLKRRRRHRRLWQGDPADRVNGAFYEAIDHMTDHGFRPPSSKTNRELALVGARSPDEKAQLAPLAGLSTRATYSDTVITDDDATEARMRLEAFEDLRREPRGPRLRARISSKSLRRGLPGRRHR